MPVLTSSLAQKHIESGHDASENSLYFTTPSRAVPEFDLNYSQIKLQPSIAESQQTETQILHNNSNLSYYPSHASPSVTGSSTPAQGAAALLKFDAPTSIPNHYTIVNELGQNDFKPPPKLPEVKCVVRARIPTTIGGSGTEMFLHLYQNSEDNKEHLAIVFGNTIRSRSLDSVRDGETEMDRLIRGAYVGRLYPGRTSSDLPGEALVLNEQQKDKVPPLVRIHSECYTGETVWSARCDCGEQLDEAARLMSTPSPSNSQASGVIIYLRQEGRGIGLGEKLKAYNLQDLGSDTVEANLLLRHPADARSYGLATAMLMDLGINQVRLLTNNPDKIRAIEGPNREIVVTERVAMVPLAWKKGELGGIRSEEVGGYLQTKINKMGHMLSMGEDS